MDGRSLPAGQQKCVNETVLVTAAVPTTSAKLRMSIFDMRAMVRPDENHSLTGNLNQQVGIDSRDGSVLAAALQCLGLFGIFFR
jgi:hypothetical protein